MHASNEPTLAHAKGDHGRSRRRAARLTATAHRAVYEHVSDRDGYRCRACGTYEGLGIHRHHLRGRQFTTPEDVCCVCSDCHARLHVRIGGKTLRIAGDAEVRDRHGVPVGLTCEWRRGAAWVRETGR